MKEAMDHQFWNILLIEDDEDDYLLTKEWLSEAKGENFRLVWMRSAEKGLDALGSDNFDVILVDYDLGGKTGVDFVQEAIARGCDAPAIIFSGRGTYEVDMLGMQAGAADFIAKAEVTPYLLERSIRYAIERRRNEVELEWRVQERTRELSEVVAALQDEIKERERAEQELRLSQERLSAVVTSAPVILWATDAGERVTLAEGNGLAALGFQREALEGQPMRTILEEFPDFRAMGSSEEEVKEAVVIASLAGKPGEILESHFTPQRDEHGKISGATGVSVIVTERIRGQQQLEYQAHLLENISDAVVAVDQRGLCTEWNRAAETIYGWKASEMLGGNLDELLQTEYNGVTPAELRQRIAETGEFHGVLAQTRRNGSQIWVETRSRAVRDGKGRQVGVVSINRDITERKRAEARAVESARRNIALAQFSQALAEASHDYQEVVDTIAEHLSLSIGDLCVIALVSPDGIGLMPVSFRSEDPEISEFVEDYLRQHHMEGSISTGVAETGETVFMNEIDHQAIRAMQPEYAPFFERFDIASLMVVPLRRRDQVIGTISLARSRPNGPYTEEDQAFLEDLTERAGLFISNAELFQKLQEELAERRRMEEALRASEGRLRTIFEESPLGIKLVDLNGTLLATNPAFQDMVGYSDQELRGKDIVFLVAPEDHAEKWAAFRSLATGLSDRFRRELRYFNREGDLLWVGMTASLVRDEDGSPLFVIEMVENLTDRKQMEAELKEVNRQLMDSRESERLHLSQELHDGPMQSLYGVIFQMQNLQSLTQERQFQQSLDTLQHQLTETNQVLRVICGELRPPALTPFGLERAIRSHAEAFMEQNPDIHLSLALMPDHRMLPERIRLALFRIYQQAMANIVRHAEANQVSVSFELDAEQVYLAVKDDGKGFLVPDRWIDFVREGHLGLAGIAERADAIGGQLNVISAPGQGTTLEVFVPQV